MNSPLETAAATLNAASAAAVVASIAGVIPPLAALFAAVWYLVQIVESRTVQKYLEARRVRLSSARLAKLKAMQKVIEAELDAVSVKQHHEAIAEVKIESAKKEAIALVKTVNDLAKPPV